MWYLRTEPARLRTDLLAPPVAEELAAWQPSAGAAEPRVAGIDPALADTENCSAAYGVPLEASANCVVVSARRGGRTWLAGCVVLATTRVDVNRVVRGQLGARKASFADQAEAVAATGMEYGGITPVGLPSEWPLLVDTRVPEQPWVVVGSGTRSAKLVLPGAALAELPRVRVVAGVGTPQQ
ncbi:prolyl-tRNA editing enzyme YbaK/EbsC (Cys-tRNA(Pro) deacylase) [Haloactinospora alba]|uniref:Prolyl-tRNA editing enzyme YbaK/EbsC (Cys-tRNA(Pro) deacylase) n=1 Tax=Haloactinospora alba TaxID=405555 RepID=A0A543NGC2_9ACTN|nr:YbaK/EbsC family protein [Haloactinospora alba]TQN30851.1 prolyl-tRNA editing enzyme YbaK/EbsC (Cys-tRNA(Pro) deacylase) [Haloactinospora alba]